MSLTMTKSARKPMLLSEVPNDSLLEDNSPFGLQGLAREPISILKPDAINKLAMKLAMTATAAQIRDPEYIARTLARHDDWVDHYQVVHLIEKSLWIQGRSNLVMTLLRNPTNIPDNPPKKILDALTRANFLHPEATVWYGVPLFSDKQNADGLPIPVSAEEVKAEAAARVKAAQDHALRWGWGYRAGLSVAATSHRVMNLCRQGYLRLCNAGVAFKQTIERARRDARIRTRAIMEAELNKVRCGVAKVQIPDHTTWIGRTVETTITLAKILEVPARQAAILSPLLGVSKTVIGLASFVPTIMLPITIVSCDPFLFVELPEEPGKLRHLGHWYWQKVENGKEKLHLHL